MDMSQSALLAATVVTAPGQIVYMHIPANSIKNFFESVVPFAKCAEADTVTGKWHRLKEGHDLLLDPLSRFEEGPIRGAVGAIKQSVHIIGDGFTKDGLPIPILTRLLIDTDIPRGFLTMRWYDGGLGLFVIAEGSSDVFQAMHGSLIMDGVVFIDTFVQGGAEIALSLLVHSFLTTAKYNPAFFVFGGLENLLAGIISTYQTASVYVDPLVFFGSAGTSAMIGFGLAYGLAGESLSQASIDSIRGGTIGAFFSLSTAFGYGALAGFVSYKLGRKLADIHNKSTRAILEIDDKAYELLLDELCKGNVHLTEFLDRAETHITFIDNAATLSTNCNLLDTGVKTLTDQYIRLNYEAKTLGENTVRLKSNAQTLPDDSPILTDLYRAILAR